MVNRHRPHVLVLPEDDANRQLANGFVLFPHLRTRNIQVLEEVGGWLEVLNRFKSDQIEGMQRYPSRLMILLIDFDQDTSRLSTVKAAIPESLTERVFVLGALSEPEALKRDGLGSYEAIGRALADDCYEGTDTTWSHPLLKHNLNELNRLRESVYPTLFNQNH
jgi:hypothetical protein